MLDPEQPVYLDVHRLEARAVAILRRFVEGPDVLLAAKAVQLAAYAPGSGPRDVVVAAAASEHPVVREAAAVSIAWRRDVPHKVVAAMISDAQVAVRARALQALRAAPRRVRLLHYRLVRRIAATDPDPRVRQLAGAVGLSR